MKVLSLWQPWASLIEVGAKMIETRSWSTTFRGPLAIHAALKWDSDLYHIAASQRFYRPLMDGGACVPDCRLRKSGSPRFLPLGCVVCIVDLVDVVPTEKLDPSPQERGFGDYSAGRFGWVLSNVRRLATPLLWKGNRGLFDASFGPVLPFKEPVQQGG